MNNFIDISVIIPVYNAATLLPRCLNSILAQKGGYEYEVLLDIRSHSWTSQATSRLLGLAKRHPYGMPSDISKNVNVRSSLLETFSHRAISRRSDRMKIVRQNFFDDDFLVN